MPTVQFQVPKFSYIQTRLQEMHTYIHTHTSWASSPNLTICKVHH